MRWSRVFVLVAVCVLVLAVVTGCADGKKARRSRRSKSKAKTSKSATAPKKASAKPLTLGGGVLGQSKEFEPYLAHIDPKRLEDLPYKYTILRHDPLVVQFDDFVSESVVKLVTGISKPFLQRSRGGLDGHLTNDRTSSTAWLTPEIYRNTAHEDKVVDLIDRIAELTQLPAVNQEHWQILHYAPKQYYKNHHDYIAETATMPCDVRVATFFIYLSDVQEGGETWFPSLDLNVKPKRGRALLWYNTKNNTRTIEKRTHHEARPVIKGEKWATNVWIHARDYHTPWALGLV